MLFCRFYAVGLLERQYLLLILHFFGCFQLLNSSQTINELYLIVFDIFLHRSSVERRIVDFSQIADDRNKVQVLFLHLLMMTTTLFCLPGSDKNLHRFEDFVCPPHVSIHEMLVVNLQKPMILFILFDRPMPSIHVLQFLPSSPAFLRTFNMHLFSDRLVLFTLRSFQR